MDTILKLFGLPSPGVLLGVVAAVLIFGVAGTGTGAYFGYQWARRAQAADVAAVQVAAIDAANRDTKSAIERAVAAAKTEANARIRAAGFRRKGEIDAAAKSKSDCSRDADSMRLLVDAIADANSIAAASNSMSDTVRPDP